MSICPEQSQSKVGWKNCRNSLLVAAPTLPLLCLLHVFYYLDTMNCSNGDNSACSQTVCPQRCSWYALRPSSRHFVWSIKWPRQCLKCPPTIPFWFLNSKNHEFLCSDWSGVQWWETTMNAFEQNGQCALWTTEGSGRWCDAAVMRRWRPPFYLNFEYGHLPRRDCMTWLISSRTSPLDNLTTT